MTFGRWRLLSIAGAAVALLSGAGRQLAAQAAITGRVIAEGTNQPLADVRVLVIGTSLSATTSDDGKYTIRNAPVGTAQLQVLRVGYQSQKKTATVLAGQPTTVDFTMTVAIAQLEEVVTTATGQARKVELGNAISTLGDVGKAVEQTTITDPADLLTAKAPGVIVLPGSTLGGAPNVRIRGVSSISLSNAPIWVVDGVRYAAGETNSGTDTPFSLLNSLNPEDIEDIEIVKGPSAATLYGTDAANGVVVITTKKGRAGASRWSWSAELGNIDDRTKYQDMYANWGHDPADPANLIRCQLATMGPSTCISDSVTHYNLLEDPTRTFIHMGHRQLGAVSVTGGSDAVRYYLSGSVDNETGPIQMPGFEVNRFNAEQVGVRNEWFHPLAQQQANFRANLSASVSPKFDISANAGWGKSDNRIEPESDLFISLYYVGMQNYGFKGPGLDKVTEQVDGTPLNDYLQYAPGDIMQFLSQQDVQRFTGSTNATWRPFAWMQNEGTIGIDHSNLNFFSLCRLNECPPQDATARTGTVEDDHSGFRNLSAKVTSTSSWNARSWANLKTTFGADYTNSEVDSVNTSGLTLPPGATTVSAAATFTSGELQPTATKTLGLYAQEQAAFRDRMFLTVAARTDQNSAFGTDFQRVVYPKASLSWIISDESWAPRFDWMNSFRLRASYGASGVQPGRTSGLALFRPSTVAVNVHGTAGSEDIPALTASSPGNADLKPERSSEFETGFETQLLNNRVHFDYTFYNKQTKDALISVPIAASAGASVTSLLENIGSTRNTGHEVQVNAQLVDMRRFGWDVTLSGSHNTATVVDLGTDPATGLPRVLGAGLTTENHAGDPINSQWYRPYTYHDDNGDGILQLNEVHVSPDRVNKGNGIPRDLFSVQTGFDLFSRRLRVNALFDYKGGYNTQDGANNFQCNSPPQSCRETQDPHAPLALQARAIAETYGSTDANGNTFQTSGGYFINGQFWKWRELSIVANLPNRLTQLMHAQNGSNITFGARNLHLWTAFTGIDPEANASLNGNETQFEFQTAAAPTYFTARLNLKY
ncbi:MAG TPA: SusC/RagA family TonB-linked outer membrane protein [Gemmatimonadaceae bacterium]|nr:SusC/RagA family TonB-linked outer membrane protein [Gemmatimonadaceae bacterium]